MSLSGHSHPNHHSSHQQFTFATLSPVVIFHFFLLLVRCEAMTSCFELSSWRLALTSFACFFFGGGICIFFKNCPSHSLPILKFYYWFSFYRGIWIVCALDINHLPDRWLSNLSFNISVACLLLFVSFLPKIFLVCLCGFAFVIWNPIQELMTLVSVVSFFSVFLVLTLPFHCLCLDFHLLFSSILYIVKDKCQVFQAPFIKELVLLLTWLLGTFVESQLAECTCLAHFSALYSVSYRV